MLQCWSPNHPGHALLYHLLSIKEHCQKKALEKASQHPWSFLVIIIIHTTTTYNYFSSEWICKLEFKGDSYKIYHFLNHVIVCDPIFNFQSGKEEFVLSPWYKIWQRESYRENIVQTDLDFNVSHRLLFPTSVFHWYYAVLKRERRLEKAFIGFFFLYGSTAAVQAVSFPR